MEEDPQDGRSALSKHKLSEGEQRGIAEVHALKEHLDRLEKELQIGTQTVNDISVAANHSVELFKDMITSVISESVNQATAAKDEQGNILVCSLSFGPGSSVAIREAASGRNALALFGDTTEIKGEYQQTVRFGRRRVKSTQGQVCGSSFVPFDFSARPERLVVLVDRQHEHTIEIATNIPDAETAVAHLHMQPWIQRTRDDESVRTATATASALALKLTEDDPVEDDKPGEFMTLKWGCIHHNQLPRPLQTNATIRRHRRFDVAISTLVQILHRRFIDNRGETDSLGNSIVAMAAMRIEDSMRRLDEIDGALGMTLHGPVDEEAMSAITATMNGETMSSLNLAALQDNDVEDALGAIDDELDELEDLDVSTFDDI